MYSRKLMLAQPRLFQNLGRDSQASFAASASGGFVRNADLLSVRGERPVTNGAIQAGMIDRCREDPLRPCACVSSTLGQAAYMIGRISQHDSTRGSFDFGSSRSGWPQSQLNCSATLGSAKRSSCRMSEGRDFNTAALALGCRPGRSIWKHASEKPTPGRRSIPLSSIRNPHRTNGRYRCVVCIRTCRTAVDR